ncbi:hypothetical protein OQA88_6037 [Cercophora sp. LCS_1]
MAPKPSAAIFALLISVSTVHAVDKTDFLDGPIQSCADVGCPPRQSGLGVECRITNKTYAMVGVSDIPGTTGLKWLETADVRDTDRRHFIRDFYLGTDPGFNISSTRACALFFANVSSNVEFKPDEISGSQSVAQGTCAQALSEQCVSRMLERAKGVNVQGISTDAACAKLRTAFEEDLDDECASFATGASWVGIETAALSGLTAPQAITPQQNTSSNCWRIQPKSYDLTLVMTIDRIGNGLISTAEKHIFAITPILTVFFPSGNRTTVSAIQSDAQLTCMRVIDLDERSLANMSPGVPESGASQRGLVSASALLVGATSLLLSIM